MHITHCITEFQIQKACLTHILHFTARLTHLCLFKAHPDPRTPAKHSEGTCTYLEKETNRAIKYWHRNNRGDNLFGVFCLGMMPYLTLFAIFLFGLFKKRDLRSKNMQLKCVHHRIYLLIIILLSTYHADVRVFTQACLTEDGKILFR